MPYLMIALGGFLAYLDWLGSANVEQAFGLFWSELTQGNPPFYKWLGAIIIVGLLGYIPDLRGIATAFLVLILLAVILNHGSSFSALVGGL